MNVQANVKEKQGESFAPSFTFIRDWPIAPSFFMGYGADHDQDEKKKRVRELMLTVVPLT